MSFNVTNACRPAQMPSTPKNVLMAICDRANDDGIAWPSLPGLCEATCYSRTAVIDAVKWLEAAGFVSVEKATGRNNRFTINVERIAATVQQTGARGKPVRQADPSATQTGTAGKPVREPDDTRTAGAPPPVRQPHPTRPAGVPEPSVTTTSTTKQPSRERRARNVAKTSIAENFTISPAVRAWAEEKGFGDLDSHLEAFIGKAQAHGYRYADWDQALMNAIRGDWAGTRSNGRAIGVNRQEALERRNREVVKRLSSDKDYTEGLSNDGRLL